MQTATRGNILIVEDDELFQRSIRNILKQKYNVTLAQSAEKALEMLSEKIPDLILLDIMLPGMDGIELLKKIKSSWSDLPVVMLTALDQIPKVVESIKFGAHDYLTKSIMAEELFLTIDRAIESSQIKRELDQRRELQHAENQKYTLVGTSPALKKIRRELKMVGKTDTTVLVLEETGTGKELASRTIHAYSPRARMPFVPINCGAIPKDLIESELFGYKAGAFTGAKKEGVGKFQLAEAGTLLLDEVGELSLDAQIKLLRVLEEQEFYAVGGTTLIQSNVRIIAATNQNLAQRVEQKLFREDLFYRLNVYSLVIPPLRERPGDIISLAEHFITEFNIKFQKNFVRLSPAAEEVLLQHPWKGNGRELRNTIERVILFGQGTVIQKEHLDFVEPTESAESSSLSSAESVAELPEHGLESELVEVEKRFLRRALQMAKQNKSRAAKLLKLSGPSFYYRLEKLGLN